MEEAEAPQGRAGQVGREEPVSHEPKSDAVTCTLIPGEPSSEPPKVLEASEVKRRIVLGNKRRAHMKKGVIRRCLGNLRHVMVATCLLTAACMGAAASKASRCVAMDRPDCLEIFAGHAEVSFQFGQWGWNTMEPIDQIYGTDLSVEENRDKVKSWIRKYRPRLVIISYPCKVWSPIMNLAYNTPQARRRLHARRLRERPFLEFCEDVFSLQLELGGDALGENPLRSASFDEPAIKRILTHPGVYSSVGHGCRYGIVHPISKKPLNKPTVWFSTSQEICDELSLKCQRDHEHDECLGGSRITEHAGKYTREIAKAIHRGFVRMLKRKEPGRIRFMLRKVSARLRKGVGNVVGLRWNEKQLKQALEKWNAVYVGASAPSQDSLGAPQPANEGPSADGTLRKVSARLRKGVGNVVGLRWNEKQLKRALEKWNAVYVGASAPSQDSLGAPQPANEGPSADGTGEETGAMEIDEGADRELSKEGIRFLVPKGRKLSEPVKQALKRIHCNLGHPSRADLERFLKLGGVSGEVVEAVGWMECLTCAHKMKPRTHRNASMPPSQVVFGDEVQLDCFKSHDAGGNGHWFLSMLDRATSFHVVRRVDDHTPKCLYDTFLDGWMSWAGPPSSVTVDMEGGFRGKEFWEEVMQHGSTVVMIAGTAHWQAGKVERHNQIVKEIIRNVSNHLGTRGADQMKQLAVEATRAKNSLVREHGWSPAALVFWA